MVDAPDPRSLEDRLGALFKPSASGPVNISQASRTLGVARSTVRRMLAGGNSPRGEDALRREERREARRPDWIEGAHEGKVAHRLFPEGMPKLPGERDIPGQIAMIASRKPDGSINVSRTARGLGVSARSLSRWLRGESRPRAMHQEQIRSETRATALSQSEGAMAAADPQGVGMSMRLKFLAKVSDDFRTRTTIVQFSPAQVNAAHLAWLNGGDEGLQQWLENDIATSYFNDAQEHADVAVSNVDGT